MLKVGDLVLWGINVSPVWHIVVERTQFKCETQYSFITLTTGSLTTEWFDTLDDLYERYKDFIISRISPDFSPTIEEVKKESSHSIKTELEKLEKDITRMKVLNDHSELDDCDRF